MEVRGIGKAVSEGNDAGKLKKTNELIK